MDYQQLFDKYYPDENEQRRILLTHSRLVADKALAIARQHPEMLLDMPFIEEAAMLHDIGIRECDAASIYCFGSKPYLCHGIIGADPHRDLVPVTLEEQLICFADKFFSKTRPDQEKSVDAALKSVAKFGDECAEKFLRWCHLFL